MKRNPLFLVPLVLAASVAVTPPAAAQLHPQPAAAPEPAAAAAAPEASADSVRRISIPEAQKAYQEGKAIFIDVRADYDYGLSHVKGALHIPAGDIARGAKDLPRDRFIITYCT